VLVTLVTKLPLLAVVGSGKPHIFRVVQGSVMVLELWQDCDKALEFLVYAQGVGVVKGTYAAAVREVGVEGVCAYAAEAVDCDGFFAGVDGACASIYRQAVEG